MTDWEKFKHSLNNHPGVSVTFAMNILGSLAGASRIHEPSGLYGAVLGFAVTSLFWIPVLLTAWTGRNNYDN